jgi:hypothetical protein
MMFGTRGDLVMALPLFRLGRIDSYVIVVQWRDEWVCACANSLDDTEWFLGHYFSSADAAVRDAYLRADVHLMPWDEIRAEAGK